MTHPLAITTDQKAASAVIRSAIEAGTLTAPHGLQGSYASLNEAGVLCHCAVGVLYPSATAYALEHLWGDGEDETTAALSSDLAEVISGPEKEPSYAMASVLITKGLLIVPPAEQNWFVNLQRKQDAWARAVGDRMSCSEIAERRRAFMEHLS